MTEQCPDEWEFEDIPHIEYNEFTVFDLENEKQAQDLNEFHWQPVARDLEFEKHLAKLKAMKQFNEGR